ncbi:MAG: hypothetical protein JWM67_1014, partial [Mycobacterium sp.]|nr:hypothetical protein [Mycobacterium sp.]
LLYGTVTSPAGEAFDYLVRLARARPELRRWLPPEIAVADGAPTWLWNHDCTLHPGPIEDLDDILIARSDEDLIVALESRVGGRPWMLQIGPESIGMLPLPDSLPSSEGTPKTRRLLLQLTENVLAAVDALAVGPAAILYHCNDYEDLSALLPLAERALDGQDVPVTLFWQATRELEAFRFLSFCHSEGACLSRMGTLGPLVWLLAILPNGLRIVSRVSMPAVADITARVPVLGTLGEAEISAASEWAAVNVVAMDRHGVPLELYSNADLFKASARALGLSDGEVLVSPTGRVSLTP